MKFVKYLGLGLLFGMVMTKSEAVSWYRIQEMFLFDSFHMYGIIGTAVVLGIITTALIKALNLQTFKGEEIKFHPKNMSIPRYLIGGIIFGLGWSMTGACPGPMYTLLGQGYWAVLIIIASALVGTYLYGALRSKLPH
ncbi:DUF6691 family protein [Saprospira grandis]|uniref:YeeE/YedE domain-containing protein n=1 Tax=Saprospira grandis (strain Lewin) TaxID=984262 RepID=H6L7W2_SAPGL|nr:DUF6691 family protein [Saprospira grandis]AFC24183.1 YeeE/YedE domain-containing protein [Saprospira grandis str. Lewin]